MGKRSDGGGGAFGQEVCYSMQSPGSQMTMMVRVALAVIMMTAMLMTTMMVTIITTMANGGDDWP